MYQYFLFRIYHFYTHVFKEKQIPVFYVGAISSLIVGFSVMLIYGFFELAGYVPPIESSLGIILFAFTLWILNYYLFIKEEKFLKKNFKNDKIGGALIVIYIIALITLLIVLGKLHRSEL